MAIKLTNFVPPKRRLRKTWLVQRYQKIRENLEVKRQKAQRDQRFAGSQRAALTATGGPVILRMVNVKEGIIINIAFKCTYNDGNKGTFIGFNGTCSEEIIKLNIEDGRTWCNESDCKKYYDKGFRGAKPTGPCYESRLFKDWEFGAGWDIYGGGDIRFRRIKQAEQGDIAIFTTRFPNEPERDRKIIGLFKIADVKDSNKHETIITADH